MVVFAYCIGNLNNKVRVLQFWIMQNREEINRITDGSQLPDVEDPSIWSGLIRNDLRMHLKMRGPQLLTVEGSPI